MQNTNLGALIFKPNLHKQTKYLLIHTMFFFGIFLVFAYINITWMNYPRLGFLQLVFAPFFLIWGIFSMFREYPTLLFEKGFKFSIYWRLKMGKNVVKFDDIDKIYKNYSSLFNRLQGTVLLTKDNKKFLIVKHYEKELLANLPEHVMTKMLE